MLRKLVVAASISASALGAIAPTAASAHEWGYRGGGYHGRHDGHGDWRARRYWAHRRWEERRDHRWRHHHRYWRDRHGYHRDYRY